MVFFFLIPSIPATLGNFLVPMMIGAKDLAFPAHQPAELVHLRCSGGVITIYAVARRRRGYRAGLSMRPTAAPFRTRYVIATGLGIFISGFFLDPDGTELHRHDPHDARAGDDLVSSAAVYLGPLCHQPDHDPGNAGDRDHHLAAGALSAWRMSASSIRQLGGDPVLFQHLFWFYSHPAVYIMVLPVDGRGERADRELLA